MNSMVEPPPILDVDRRDDQVLFSFNCSQGRRELPETTTDFIWRSSSRLRTVSEVLTPQSSHPSWPHSPSFCYDGRHDSTMIG